MHALPVIAIGFLLGAIGLHWAARALCLPRIRHYLGKQGLSIAGSSYAVPEMHDFVAAFQFAEEEGEAPSALKWYNWLNGAAACFLATGFGLVLACDLAGVRSGPTGSLTGRFPNWAIAYALMMWAPSILATRKPRRPVWLAAVESTAWLGRLTTFVAYWLTEVPAAIVFLVFSCSWVEFGWKYALDATSARVHPKISKLPVRQRRFLTLVTVSSMIALNLPLFWFGLKAAMRGL